MAIKRLRQTASLEERLHNRLTINKSTGCWDWLGCKNNIGYGFIRDGKKMRTVHRVSYELNNNATIPDDTCVFHLCSNYLCCNPAHLELGDRKDLTTHMFSQGHANVYGGNLPVTCTHCSKTRGRNMLRRWHNDNCKHKPRSINTLHSGNAYTPI